MFKEIKINSSLINMKKNSYINKKLMNIKYKT